MTSDTGAWRQTIFYPYMHASVYGRGTVLNTQVLTPVYESKTYGDAPYLDSVCIWDEEHDALTIFAVNKSLDEDMEVSCDLRQFEGYRLAEHIVLTNDDMKAVNTEADPDHVAPTHSDATKAQLECNPSYQINQKHKACPEKDTILIQDMLFSIGSLTIQEFPITSSGAIRISVQTGSFIFSFDGSSGSLFLCSSQ